MSSKIIGVIAPHKKISRLVKEEDLQTVYEDAEKMHTLCDRPVGIYKKFYAIAHPQCVEEDPMRFFVLRDADEQIGNGYLVIINPVILKHTNSTIDSEEGCASMAKFPPTTVQRYNKCEVEFSPLEFKKNESGDFKPAMGKRVTRNLSGKIAKIFQHETDHLNAKYIYDI